MGVISLYDDVIGLGFIVKIQRFQKSSIHIFPALNTILCSQSFVHSIQSVEGRIDRDHSCNRESSTSSVRRKLSFAFERL